MYSQYHKRICNVADAFEIPKRICNTATKICVHSKKDKISEVWRETDRQKDI